jgi:signal peptidase
MILSRQKRSKRTFVKFVNVEFLPNLIVVSLVMLSTTMEELLTHTRKYHKAFQRDLPSQSSHSPAQESACVTPLFQNPYKVICCSDIMDWKHELREIAEGVIIAVILYLIIQATLMVTLGVERPLYVVISGSMEPVYYEGDILVVGRADVNAMEVGDIIVFDSPSGGIPIVHRVNKVIEEGENRYFVTKGDNNLTLDNYYQNVYPGIPEDHIIGKPVLKIPKVGWLQIWLKQLIDVIRCPYLQPV